MPGMFYSLKEVSEKLGKSENDVRELVKNGRLREFRDGANLLFKVDEVNALMSDTSAMGIEKGEAPEAPVLEPQDEIQLEEEKTSAAPEPQEAPEQPEPKLEAETEEILLGPDTTSKAEEEIHLSDADTQIVDEGIKVLGDTDAELAPEGADETFKGSNEATPAAKEASLEDIEKDVSLDTFGSGSGLLDLSLQADDTSLGGILDEIYTPGAEGGKPTTMEPAAAEGSSIEVEAEAEQILSSEPQIAIPASMTAAYAEAAPDAMSNAMGVMLFIPLFAVIYTAVAAVAGFSNIMPALLKSVQGFIWYVAIGMAVVSGIIVAAGATMGGEKKPKVPKPPKVKKVKPPKPAKVKKGKEAKP